MDGRDDGAAAVRGHRSFPLASSRDFRVALSDGSIGVGSPARPNHPADPPVRRSDLVELFPNDLPLRKFIRARRAPAPHSAADDARAEHEARQTVHGLPAARVARSRAAREAVAARGPQESKSAAEQQPVRRARGGDCLWLSLHSRGLPQLWHSAGGHVLTAFSPTVAAADPSGRSREGCVCGLSVPLQVPTRRQRGAPERTRDAASRHKRQTKPRAAVRGGGARSAVLAAAV